MRTRAEKCAEMAAVVRRLLARSWELEHLAGYCNVDRRTARAWALGKSPGSDIDRRRLAELPVPFRPAYLEDAIRREVANITYRQGLIEKARQAPEPDDNLIQCLERVIEYCTRNLNNLRHNPCE